MFGGQAVHNVSLFTDGETYLSMSNITLFDPSTQLWHYQPSSGDIPSQRDRFCVVGASGGDNTTFGESAYAIASSPSCLTNIFLAEISMYSGQAGAGMYGGIIGKQCRARRGLCVVSASLRLVQSKVHHGRPANETHLPCHWQPNAEYRWF